MISVVSLLEHGKKKTAEKISRRHLRGLAVGDWLFSYKMEKTESC